MAGLCWMAVMLAFSMSVGNSLPVDVNEDWVKERVRTLNQIRITDKEVCLAVNFPVDENKLKEVEEELKKDKESIKEAINDTGNKGADVYQRTNVVVAATFQRNTGYTYHAEARVLDKIQPLVDNSKDHILVLYSYLSPCDEKCTNQNHNYNILDKIDSTINLKDAEWADHAFVFTEVYNKKGKILVDNIRVAITNLGDTKIGRNKIFRCYYPENSSFKCIKCFNNGVLSDECVKNKPQMCQSHNRDCGRVSMEERRSGDHSDSGSTNGNQSTNTTGFHLNGL